MSDIITNTTSTNEGKVFNVYVSKSTTAGTALVTRGSLNKTDTAPTVAGLYILEETGVYTNLGNIDAQAGKLNFASFDGTTWSLIAVDMPKGADGKTIEDWSAKDFPIGSSVYYNGKIYYNATTAAASTDVPGVSSNWVAKLEGIENLPKIETIFYNNLSSDFTKVQKEGGATVVQTINPDGSLNLKKLAGVVGNWSGYNFALNSDQNFKLDHTYAVYFDLIVNKNTLTETGGSNTGNNVFNITYKNNNSSLGIGGWSPLNSIVTGARGIVSVAKPVVASANLTENSRWIYMQFGAFTSDTSEFDITIYNMFVVDLTEHNLTKEQMDIYISENGLDLDEFKDTFYDITVAKSKVAENAENGGSSPNTAIIDIWGDSLVAQGYGTTIGTLLGRTVITNGYGGKKSSYIRDIFLANPIVKTRPQIINVGRNNVSNYETVIDDIRAMVDYMGHQNFLIGCPPNGGYGTNGEGATETSNFYKLEKILAAEYGANFLNTRLGTIYTYDNGNIKLLSSFTQPAVGTNVQISVSDTAFLTTYNANDLAIWPDRMNKIVIGGVNGTYDIYEVVSVDSATLMTVKLITSNRVAVGGTVTNLVDDGGNNSVIYLRVMQNADYYCLSNEITQSTFRSDGIHMSPRGLQTIAKVVARKVKTMNF